MIGTYRLSGPRFSRKPEAGSRVPRQRASQEDVSGQMRRKGGRTPSIPCPRIRVDAAPPDVRVRGVFPAGGSVPEYEEQA